MSRHKLHSPGRNASPELDQALKTLGRVFGEVTLWRAAALAWREAYGRDETALAAALAAHKRAAEASGAPRGAELSELEGMSDATKALAVGSTAIAEPSETPSGTNERQRQGLCLRCFRLLTSERWCSWCLRWADATVEAAPKAAAGGAPAPAGEGAQPTLGKIANTCSRAKAKLGRAAGSDAQADGCAGRLSCLELQGPGPLCRLHAALLSTIPLPGESEAWGLGVAGEARPYRYLVGRKRGWVALANSKDQRGRWVRIVELVSVRWTRGTR